MIYIVSTMRTLIRTELNESTTTRISNAEILAALNEGYKFVATRGLCYEAETAYVTTVGRNIIKHAGLRVNSIEYLGLDSLVQFTDGDIVFTDGDVTWYTTSGVAEDQIGLQCILPTNVGYVPLKGTQPQKWFPWGKYVVLEPTPDARYVLKLYIATYPAALVGDTDELLVPDEFKRSVVDYAESVLCIKLRRWAEVGAFYNKCIIGTQKARAEFVKSRPDPRAARDIPKEVKEVQSGD